MKQVISVIIVGLFFWASSVGAKEWYETASFYQIYPQTFLDTGNGKSGTGDLKGIEEKLDYLQNLGIDCLWLTPIFQSSYHAFGYDITDYKAIDPRYGSNEDFKNLVKAVHDKGMKIIVDFVPNHCGINHPFFVSSINKVGNYSDWFVWTNKTGNVDLQKPSNWQMIGDGPGTAWNSMVERSGDFYYAQFGPLMPDLNMRNKEVQSYLKEVMKFWLDEFELDGFRIDAITHGIEALPVNGIYQNEAINPNVTDPKDYGYLVHTLTQDQPELFDEIIYDWRQFLDDYQKEKNTSAKIIMTESYSPPAIIKKYYQSDDGTKNGAHLPFNFQMINIVKNESVAADIVGMVNDWFAVVPKGKVTNWVIGNHDHSRAATRFGKERVDILNTLITMLPGTSVTYYGEEIGMTDSCASYNVDHNATSSKCDSTSNNQTDANYRSPMQWNETLNGGFSNSTPWIPIGDDYKTVNVKAQEGISGSHLEIHRQLLKLRKNKAIAESDKDLEIKALNTSSFGFKRELADTRQQSVFVLINFGSKNETVDIKKTFTGFPDLMTVEIAGGNSAFKKGQQLSTSEFELKPFESIVAFYNSSMVFTVSKVALLLLLAVCVRTNLKI